MWEHQIDAVNYMKSRQESGKRGNIIWIPVGLGKTLIVMTYLSQLIAENRMPEYCIYSLPPSAIDSITREIQYFGLQPHLIDMRKDAAEFFKRPQPKTINLIPHDTLRLVPWLNDIAPNCFVIIDEFHKALNKTQRTSAALELARLSYDFIAMSGTIVTSDNVDDLLQWLRQIVDFEVTEKNFWVAIGNMISRKVTTKLVINRVLDDAEMLPEERERYNSITSSGRMSTDHFLEAIKLCRHACTRRMVQLVLQYIQSGKQVFLVAKDKANAEEFRRLLTHFGVGGIFVIGTDGMITMTPRDNKSYQVVITTTTHNAGYSLSAIQVMITSVYFTNQATREQLEGRIMRIDSLGPSVDIVTVTAGLLTQVFAKYEKARSLSAALREFADNVSIDTI